MEALVKERSLGKCILLRKKNIESYKSIEVIPVERMIPSLEVLSSQYNSISFVVSKSRLRAERALISQCINLRL